MTCIINTKSKRSLSAGLAAGLAISAFFAVGTFAVPAKADGDRGYHRGGEYHAYRGYRGWNRGWNRGWSGGYYRAPPIIYGSPYYYPYYPRRRYYPPPIVYDPGIYVPGISVQIR